MPDMVQMILVQGCDADGVGGTVLDAPKVIIPNGKLNEVMAAFQDAYGLHKIDNEAFNAGQPESEENPRQVPVSAARNLTYRVRLYVQEIWAAYGKKLAEAQARAAAEAAAAATMGQLQVKE